MIAQSSNNRPSGSTAKQCDAGIPVVGRTSATGEYQILKVAADGSLATSGGGNTPLPDATTAYMTQAQMIAFPAGGYGANQFLSITGITSNVIDAGLYRFNPFYMFSGVAGGTINLALTAGGSALSNYANTLNPFVDAFNPATTDFFSGLAGFWHANPVQSAGGTACTPYNRNNALNVYLVSASYNLIAWVDTAINSLGAVGYAGAIEFTKIG